jgi:predicted Fe-S protein YdhL (DUF1289 family)
MRYKLGDQKPELRGDVDTAREGADPASPCISVCALDDNDVCMGCYRSADEITDWFMASYREKQAILARAVKRRDTDGGVRLL